MPNSSTSAGSKAAKDKQPAKSSKDTKDKTTQQGQKSTEMGTHSLSSHVSKASTASGSSGSSTVSAGPRDPRTDEIARQLREVIEDNKRAWPIFIKIYRAMTQGTFDDAGTSLADHLKARWISKKQLSDYDFENAPERDRAEILKLWKDMEGGLNQRHDTLIAGDSSGMSDRSSRLTTKDPGNWDIEEDY